MVGLREELLPGVFGLRGFFTPDKLFTKAFVL
jgi:hypothetical protein